MAVVRQKKQYFSSGIGVNRINTGTAEAWESVRDTVNQLTQITVRQGERRAEQAGTELALDLDIDQIAGIDPVTEKRQPIAAPQGYGTIAQDAYRRVVDARYMDHAADLIKLKAKELGGKYKRNPELFKTSMSQFIADSSEAAEGKYANIIKEQGASYLSSTYLTLLDQQRTRSRQRESDLTILKSGKSSEEAYNYASSGDYLTARTLAKEQMSVLNDAYTADLISPAQYQSTLRNLRFSVATGAIEGVMKRLRSPEARKQFVLFIKHKGSRGRMPDIMPSVVDEDSGALLKAFDAQEIKAIRKLLITNVQTDRDAAYDFYVEREKRGGQFPADQFNEIQSEINLADNVTLKDRTYVDRDNMNQVVSFAEDISVDMDAIYTIKARQAAAEFETQAMLSSRRADRSTADTINRMESEVSTNLASVLQQFADTSDLSDGDPMPSTFAGITGVIQNTSKMLLDQYSILDARHDTDKTYTTTELESDKRSMRENVLGVLVQFGIAEGNSELFLNALNGGSVYDGLSESQMTIVSGLHSYSNIYSRSNDSSFVNEYVADNKNKVGEKIADAAGSLKIAQSASEFIDRASTEGFGNLFKEFQVIMAKGALLGDQSSTQAINQEEKYRDSWAKSIFDGNSVGLDSVMMNSLSKFIRQRGQVSSGNNMIDELGGEILSVIPKGQDITNVTGHIESVQTRLKQQESQQTITRTNLVNYKFANMGITTPEKRASAQFADGQIVTMLTNRTDLEGAEATAVLSSMLLDPSSAIPPSEETFPSEISSSFTASQMVKFDIARGVIPQAFVNNLKSVANGSLSNSQIVTTMQHFANLAFSKTESGVDRNMLDQFASLIGKDTLAKLDAIHSISKVKGSNAIPDILMQIASTELDATFQESKKLNFGTGYTFVTTEFPDEGFSEEAISILAPVADYLYSASGNVESVRSSIEEIYKQKFIQTDGFVLDVSQRDEGRSMHALSQVFPKGKTLDSSPHDVFISHVTSVIQSITREKGLPDYNFGLSGGFRNTFPRAGDVFLVPLEKSSDLAVYYMAMEQDKFGEKRPVFKDGFPVHFSSNEPYLNDSRNALEAERNKIGLVTDRQIERRGLQLVAGDVGVGEQSDSDMFSPTPMMTPSEMIERGVE